MGIRFSKEMSDRLRACREAIPGEANRLGLSLAHRLNDFYYKEFIGSPCFSGMRVVLSPADLLEATTAYAIDLLRIVAFHPINEIDNHKLAAYLFKWLCKLRPVRLVVDATGKFENRELYANACFSFLCAKRYLDIGNFLPKNELEYILYSATHRDIHPEEWAGMFYFMEVAKSVDRGKNPEHAR